MNYNSDLMRGAVDPIVLKLVAQKPMYGYEIIKVVNQKTEGKFEWNEGSLYPCLHRLEGDKLIESEWMKSESGRKRKYYRIAKKGQKVLEAKTNEWASFSVAVNSILMPSQA